VTVHRSGQAAGVAQVSQQEMPDRGPLVGPGARTERFLDVADRLPGEVCVPVVRNADRDTAGTVAILLNRPVPGDLLFDPVRLGQFRPLGYRAGVHGVILLP